MLPRRNFLSLPIAAFAQRTRRPNIVFIMADDLGYGDLGCYGQKRILTPNIDRLAAEGMRFTQAYAGSTVCAPSRCCLHTGKHTGHARVRGNIKIPGEVPLEPGDVTVAEVLKQAGYRTGIFGKWALGLLGSTGYPLDQGFEEFFGFFSQSHAHSYYPEHLLDGRGALQLVGNTGTQKKDYAPDVIHRRALAFLDRQRAGEPFFLYVPMTIPHTNNELGRDTQNGQEVPEDAPYTSESWPQVEKNFAAMVTRMDRQVGEIVEAVRAKGLEEDTIFFFTSDNGAHQEGGHKADFFQSSGPLRGVKRDLYDGGIRVPMIARWKGRIRPGQTSEQVWAFWDFLPTAAELAGAAAPGGIDGVSLAPTLLGQGTQQQHEYLYWEFHERTFAQAVRMGRWKAVRWKTAVELYDVTQDPGERTDVAGQHPEVVARALAIFQSARVDHPLFPVAKG
jgi:arylsulfatase A-like enzyme